MKTISWQQERANANKRMKAYRKAHAYDGVEQIAIRAAGRATSWRYERAVAIVAFATDCRKAKGNGD